MDSQDEQKEKSPNKEVDLKEVFVKYPTPGKKYRHFKGGLYIVLAITRHSETDELLVIYKSLLFHSIHARPLSMWFEEIKVKDSTVPITRFTETL